MKKEDKRARLTRLLLEQAIIELLAEQPISKITVTALCERAGISRGAFYANYQDTYDLLEHIEQSTCDDLRRYLSEHETYFTRIKELLQYVSDNKQIYKILLGENGTRNFKEDIMSMAQEFTEQDMINPENAYVFNYIFCFAVNGCISILQQWLK